jgi:hypothetical protein
MIWGHTGAYWIVLLHFYIKYFKIASFIDDIDEDYSACNEFTYGPMN